MKVVVVASGPLAAGDLVQLDDADLVIAADGGAAGLERVGRRPDLVVGDLDSAPPAVVERLERHGVPVRRHPADKEASDTELAVEAARAAGAARIVLLGAIGGERLDHELANLLLLADPAMLGVGLRAVRGRTTVRALAAGSALTIEAPVGGMVTLLPIGGDAVGISTSGLRWALERDTLHMGRSRGLSNEVVEADASVHLERGTLLVVETEPERSSST